MAFWGASGLGAIAPYGSVRRLHRHRPQQARATRISIDKFGWEFHVLPSEMGTVTQSAKEGAYMRGIYLEVFNFIFNLFAPTFSFCSFFCHFMDHIFHNWCTATMHSTGRFIYFSDVIEFLYHFTKQIFHFMVVSNAKWNSC